MLCFPYCVYFPYNLRLFTLPVIVYIYSASHNSSVFLQQCSFHLMSTHHLQSRGGVRIQARRCTMPIFRSGFFFHRNYFADTALHTLILTVFDPMSLPGVFLFYVFLLLILVFAFMFTHMEERLLPSRRESSQGNQTSSPNVNCFTTVSVHTWSTRHGLLLTLTQCIVLQWSNLQCKFWTLECAMSIHKDRPQPYPKAFLPEWFPFISLISQFIIIFMFFLCWLI